jgi:hypothetical protein
MTTTAAGTKTAKTAETAASKKTTGTKRSASSSRQGGGGDGGTRAAARERRTATVRLPGVTAEFHTPEVHMPHLPTPREVGRAAGAATSFLPPRERLIWYGGLGTAAVLGVIEWPVAVAVGAGTVIAQRALRQRDSGGPARRTSAESKEQA